MKLRNNILSRIQSEVFDVLIVGGGINGASSAAALSAKGIKTALIDKGDYANFTSQESSNLVWGGIKYLESGEISLVNKLCRSRNHLIKSYPSSIKEIRFFTTLAKGFRLPRIFLYIGAWIYWLIGRGFTKIPRLLSRSDIDEQENIINTSVCVGGIEYSDAYLIDNDARFVFGFIRDALDNGAACANYVEMIDSYREDGVWHSKVLDKTTGRNFIVKSRALINAAGPFADSINTQLDNPTTNHHLFSKGIHLVVNKLSDSNKVLTFFADDGRLFFIIPMGPKSCIGTTDTRVEKLPAYITHEDRVFVLDNINKRLNLDPPLSEADIISERCGVRPLVSSGGKVEGDWTSLSRKHSIEKDPLRMLITIFGGKLTDCLNIGDEISEIIESFDITATYPTAQWYGEPLGPEKQKFFHQAELMNLDGLTAPNSSEPLSNRLWRRYNRRAFTLLNDIQQDPDMAKVIIEGGEYIRGELYLAKQQEMIVNLSDFLRRRTKIGLITSKSQLASAKGLPEVCQILFEEEAESKYQEYFEEQAKPKP